MSAAGAVRDLVESLVKGFTDALHAKDAEQDDRLTRAEQRLDALEKPTAARAGAASATAKASPRK